jgi:phosphoglycolate phosphatase
MRYSLLILDIDGTLADSFPWFLRHVNGVADKFGFRRIAAGDVEALRRAGPREILKRLDVPVWKLPLIARHMRRLKAAHLDDIPLFAGVDVLLQALAARGTVLAIVSSDSEANARRALGPDNAKLISHYVCGASLFGKAALFKRVLKMARVPAAAALCIGDEIRDLKAARQAGIAFGAVAWGYASAEALRARGPDLVFVSMADIAGCVA